MNLIKLSWSYIKAKPLSSLLNVVLVALGVSLTSILLLINYQFQDRLYRNIENIHLVVGAKGSPLQMILSSVYHIDVPTGNIPLDEAPMITKNSYIEKYIPLALGDSYNGFRIVGTTLDYIKHYNAFVVQGNYFLKDMEVVVGDRAARKLNLQLGSTFYGSHGLVESANTHEHKEFAYKVVGILAPSNTVLDQLILTNVSSVWRVHEGHDHEEEGFEETDSIDTDSTHAHHGHDHVHGDGHDHHHHHPTDSSELPPISSEGKEITAFLVTYKKDGQGSTSAMAATMVPKLINENSEKMGCAVPAIQLQRLMEMTGVGASFLRALAWIIILISGFSVFISLYNSLKDRKYEIALMRVMGASKTKIFFLVILEGIILAILGCIIGLSISHLGMGLLAGYLETAYQYTFSGILFLIGELYLVVGMVAVGFFAAFIPALQAYNMNISNTLAKG